MAKKTKLTDKQLNEPELYVVPNSWTQEVHEEVTAYIRQQKANRSPEEEAELAKVRFPYELDGYLAGVNTLEASVGAWLGRLVRACNWDEATFGAKAGLTEEQAAQLLAGTRRISPEIALKLEAVSEIKAERWLALQARYDLDQLRNK